MMNLFLDLSEGDVRLVLTEGYRLVDQWTLDAGSYGERAEDVIARVHQQVGQKIDQAHLILPERMVTTDFCRLQRMSLEDAEKVVSRQGESAGDSSVLRLTELAGPQHQIHCIQESVSRIQVENLKRTFDALNIKLKTIQTPLQALLAAFSPLRQEMDNVEVVFHVSETTITTLFLSREEILHHEVVVVPEAEYSPMELDDPSRVLKRRQFAVLTPLHGIYSSFMREHPDVRVDKIWVTGTFEGIVGLAESLTEATGLQVVLADHIADFDEGSCAFTALAGLMRVKDDPSRANFIPEELLKKVVLRPKVVWYAAVGFLAVLALAVVASTETRLLGIKKQLRSANQELSGLELSSQMSQQLRTNLRFLTEIDKHPTPFYEIFRELANHLPAQFMISGMHYQDDPNGPSLKIAAVADYEIFQGDSSVLVDLKTALEQSEYLANHKDPVIEILSSGERRQVQVTISCSLPGRTSQ